MFFRCISLMANLKEILKESFICISRRKKKQTTSKIITLKPLNHHKML